MKTPGSGPEIHHMTQEDRDKTIERVLELIRNGQPEFVAAEQAGISYPTWWLWRRDTPGLTERMNEAKMYRVPILEDRLYKAAMDPDKCSVKAILSLLEKYDESWRKRARQVAPTNPVFIFQGGAAQIVGMLSEDKRKKFLGSLHMAGLLPENIVDIAGAKPSENGNTNGSNGHAAH